MKRIVMKSLHRIAISLAAGLAFSSAFAADEALVKRGEYLARVGDCAACHSVAGKPAFAGGLAIDSGHGIIYSSNITPDKQHGIGGYTEAQFADALRKGMRADGKHLYPAMPYPSYSKVTNDDVHALYAYFMSGVKADATPSREADMGFPFNQRWGMAFWNYFFASNKPFVAPAGASEQITRGAYLVEGLGHCGSCHTPRGFAMNEKASTSGEADFLAGGDLGGWPTPSLRGLSQWSTTDIVDYLQTGRSTHASVAGEMTEVVAHSGTFMTGEDLGSIAAYLKNLPPAPVARSDVKPQGAEQTAAKLTAATDLTLGERLYMDNCAACHFVTGQGASRVFPKLDGASVINAPSAKGLVHVILAGARTPSTEKAPSILVMPPFGRRMDDSEVAALATFLRQAWGNQASAVDSGTVAAVRGQLAKH